MRSSMECPAVLGLIAVIMSYKAAPAVSQTIYASENPIAVGSEVTLFSQSPVTTGVWMFNNTALVLIFPGDRLILDDWNGTVSFNLTTSSLTIRSLRLENSGIYTLQGANSFLARLTLSVQVPISNVSLAANATNLVEFNDTAIFRCSVATGTSLTYTWLNDDSVVTAGVGVTLSDGGATLSIAAVTRYDRGPFRCNVSNGVSDEISQPVYLNISYGPSNTTMMIMPSKYIYRTGSNITLSCSTESNPAATIQWMVDGMDSVTSPQLQLQSVTESNSGNYQCIFHNTVTGRFSSASATIRILAPITAVAVNRTGGPAILDESFTLYCEVTGPVDSIQWLRNGQLITADNATIFGTNNTMLTLNPVQLSDDGDYQCQAFNYVSNMSSSLYTVKVNYGPRTPVIMGSSMALEGQHEVFNCTSDSYPPSDISWYFNNSLVANTSTFETGPLNLNMSGKYICMAFNYVTGKNSAAYTMLTVLAPVTRAEIKIVGSQPILNHTFTLTCETAGGVESISWMYGRSPLYADNTRNLSADNATLTFDPVMFSHNGEYRCVASNPLSSLISEAYMLDVFYGPEMPTIMGPDVAKVGDSVMLTCNASSNPPSIYKWFFSGSVVANTSVYVTPALTVEASGMYTCMAFNDITGENSTAYMMLTVVEGITDIQVEEAMNPPIDGNFFDLTCNITGPVDRVYWMKNGDSLQTNTQTVISMDNKTVSFNPLQRSDNGSYQCTAMNAVSNMTSSPYQLLVNFGPETPIISGPTTAVTGSTAVFHCYAESEPPCQYSWSFNGEEVANTSVLTTANLTVNMSGVYLCEAYNNVTGRRSSSNVTLSVKETTAVVKVSGMPINMENFTLTCEVTGPFDQIDWKVISSEVAEFTNDTEKLHFTPVTTEDSGSYQCFAINQNAKYESPIYELQVNYGPQSVTISGPDSAYSGDSVSLTCAANSYPVPDFVWIFNNQASDTTSSEMNFVASDHTVGNYTCKVTNHVTNITMFQTKVFTLNYASTIHIPSHNSLMLMGLFALSLSAMFS
ncbi:uncharacterized protein V6R79_015708 [Siganus canaliculatus]